MFDFVYAEEQIIDHPRTRRILSRFPQATLVPCARYGELFNRAAQNFRLQKKRPALVLAHKTGNRVLPTPPGYGVGSERNYYFTHLLNCPYDCRYCFLQGLYRSAHMVVFVNYEDFQQAIAERIVADEGHRPFFFSGYDGDSLALEGITHFADSFLPFFAAHPQAAFELRTKSVRIRGLLARPAQPNCVIAFSMTPPAIARQLELGAPSVERRLQAARALQEHGWPVGLRFDPLICHPDFERHYRDLFAMAFSHLRASQLHSASLGSFRLPRDFFARMLRLYPEEKLFAWGLEERGGMVSYRAEWGHRLHDFCLGELRRHLPPERLFPCPTPHLEAP